MCLVVDSLRGSVKQPRGFGSQHFATVNVTGLQTDRGADRQGGRQTGGQTDRGTGSRSSISIISSIISTCSRLHVRRTCSEVIVGVQTLIITPLKRSRDWGVTVITSVTNNKQTFM